jgi:hypothetical protein
VVWYRFSYDLVDRALFGLLVSPVGSVVSPNEFVVSRYPYGTDDFYVAYGCGKYIAAWSNNTNTYASRITTEGVSLDTTGILLGSQKYYPIISYDKNDNYILCWNGSGGLWGTKIDTTGTGWDTVGVYLGYNKPSGSAAIAKGDSSWLLVWSDWRHYSITYDCDIYAELVKSDLQIQDSIVVGNDYYTIANDQSLPAVAFDGNKYAAAWKEYNAKDNMRCSIVDTTGETIMASTIDTNIYQPFYGNTPVISCGVSSYMLFWGMRYTRFRVCQVFCVNGVFVNLREPGFQI